MSTKVTELLRMYPSYKRAVISYESHHPTPSAGIANYDPMPSGHGAPLLFFEQQGRMADMGRTGLKDLLDYRELKRAVEDVSGALNDALTETEKEVIELKWMKGVSLKSIEERKFMGKGYARQIHRTAYNKLVEALRFTNVPKLEQTVFVEYNKVSNI
jgi:hypothetical protein